MIFKITLSTCVSKANFLTKKKEKSPTCCNFEIFDHNPQQYDFQNYTGYAYLKSELLDPKKEKSPTRCNLKFMTTTPNLTSYFETYKNVGDNF